MEEYLETSPKIIAEIRDYITHGEFRSAADLFGQILPADQAKFFITLTAEEQRHLLTAMEIPDIADIFDELDDQQTLDAANNLPLPFLADIIDDMDPDEAADLLGDLSGKDVRRTISFMEEPEEVLPLLRYPDDTAGGRMTTDFLVLRPEETVEEAIRDLRKSDRESDVPYYLFVVGDSGSLIGVTGLRELVSAEPEQAIASIMNTHVIQIEDMEDQEEAARLMKHYDLSALPVVDRNQRLKGVISHDDILDVLVDESTEDIYRLASVSDTAIEPESGLGRQLRGRLPWLLLNTVTALFGSWVISNFGDLFVQVAVLAFFQSVVASQGGSAASQNVAMIVRGLALGKIDISKAWPIMLRQVAVGMMIGVMIGVIVGVGVGYWQSNPILGLVLGLALLGNMLVASFVGTLAPIVLQAVGQDPALASSVLVTAMTDSLGFLIFLSLAQIFLPLIQQYM